jgi:hypothetical protein
MLPKRFSGPFSDSPLPTHAQPLLILFLRCTPTHLERAETAHKLARAGEPPADLTLELAEKINNYLNICRIAKSSEARPAD